MEALAFLSNESAHAFWAKSHTLWETEVQVGSLARE